MAVAVATALAGIGGTTAAGETTVPPPPELRSVLLVGNNWDGTVDFVDPQTFRRLTRFNVAPDFEQRLAEMTPDQRLARELNNEFAAEGNDQLVDDMRVSPNGRVLYVSRPSLGDAAAFDIATRKLLWHVDVSGFRSDHIALSPDGRELIVSATTANVVDVINTRTATIVDQIPTGDFPHENEYSHDGQLIFNGSIGRVITPDDPALDAAKGNRWFTIADADTHAVKKVIDFGRGIRPYAVLPNNRTMYVQLSFLSGFVEYDLVQERRLRIRRLPLSEEAQQMDRSDYPLDSAHHGLALNNDYTKICVAGTISDYAAIIWRRSFQVQRIIPVGDKPYWAASSADGRYCFIANSDTDNVSVISYGTAREVARFRVGDHPQRMRMAAVQLP
jgi:DNA-binding beta-propeller fold protein YncE